MSNQIATNLETQHKQVKDLFTYNIYKNETVNILKGLEYNRQQNTYRIYIAKGHQMINYQILDQINKSNWEINYILAEEFVNYHTKPLPDVTVYLVIGLKPKSGAIN